MGSVMVGLSLGFLFAACRQEMQPKVSAEASSLKKPGELLWALEEADYAVAKAAPIPSRHGCQSSEYVAAKDGAHFKISVFHCGSFEQTRALVENDSTRHIDEVLRRAHDGFVLQRGPLQIMVRKTDGPENAVRILYDLIGGL